MCLGLFIARYASKRPPFICMRLPFVMPFVRAPHLMVVLMQVLECDLMTQWSCEMASSWREVRAT
jgi:hypothetical protein